jgi:3-phosphoshikimate 1-carboxyvinyltransferase
MGISVVAGRDELLIHGKGPEGLFEPANVLDMGNSGTSARLLTGLLAGQPFFSVLTGDSSLRQRPMGRVVNPLREMGAQIAGRARADRLPLAVLPGALKAASHTLPVASAQVKSALLLAGLFTDGVVQVTEPIRSRDHTERMLRFFGAGIETEGLRVSLKGRQALEAREVDVPGDISSAAFFIVGAIVVPGSDLRLRGVGVNPTRTGILDVLQEMGAAVVVENLREEAGEPVADLHVRHSPLKGAAIGGDLIPRLIDEIPILCVAAALADGDTVIRDARELRVKETDRIETMAVNLRKMGVEVETAPDGLVIHGGRRRMIGGVCTSFGDHRIAMSMAIAGLTAEGDTLVEDTECIETSFPDFEAMLRGMMG